MNRFLISENLWQRSSCQTRVCAVDMPYPPETVHLYRGCADAGVGPILLLQWAKTISTKVTRSLRRNALGSSCHPV